MTDPAPSPSPRRTILFYAVEGQGHVNASCGLAHTFRRKGHRCVFATHPLFKGKLSAIGFEEIVFNEEDQEPERLDVSSILQMAPILALPTIDRLDLFPAAFARWFSSVEKLNESVGAIAKDLNPDLIIIDSPLAPPSLITTASPWVSLWSGNPLFLYQSHDLPPPSSGYGTSESERPCWDLFTKKFQQSFGLILPQIKEWYLSQGADISSLEVPYPFVMKSPYLTCYQYPKEMDYDNIVQLSPNHIRFDHLIRPGDIAPPFEIPAALIDKPGKLVLFSMGSFGGADTAMMTRLLGILKDSPHRFIVSKGPMGDTFELPGDNMWGENFLPQLSVYPMVDLVMTHGGNNTLCECFYFGKKMVCLPLFGDQPDNAQRLEELKFGRLALPYHVTKEELLTTIEEVLNDNEMQARIQAVSQRMRSENSLNEATERAEALLDQMMNK